MDKIIIKDLKVIGIIGIYDQERITPQEMLINITMDTDTRKAAESDDIGLCVDYEKVALKVKALAESARRLTVEALAEDIARICLAMPGVQRVVIRLEKTQAISFTSSVGIEIERENNNWIG